MTDLELLLQQSFGILKNLKAFDPNVGQILEIKNAWLSVNKYHIYNHMLGNVFELDIYDTGKFN